MNLNNRRPGGFSFVPSNASEVRMDFPDFDEDEDMSGAVNPDGTVNGFRVDDPSMMVDLNGVVMDLPIEDPSQIVEPNGAVSNFEVKDPNQIVNQNGVVNGFQVEDPSRIVNQNGAVIGLPVNPNPFNAAMPPPQPPVPPPPQPPDPNIDFFRRFYQVLNEHGLPLVDTGQTVDRIQALEQFNNYANERRAFVDQMKNIAALPNASPAQLAIGIQNAVNLTRQTYARTELVRRQLSGVGAELNPQMEAIDPMLIAQASTNLQAQTELARQSSLTYIELFRAAFPGEAAPTMVQHTQPRILNCIRLIWALRGSLAVQEDITGLTNEQQANFLDTIRNSMNLINAVRAQLALVIGAQPVQNANADQLAQMVLNSLQTATTNLQFVMDQYRITRGHIANRGVTPDTLLAPGENVLLNPNTRAQAAQLYNDTLNARLQVLSQISEQRLQRLNAIAQQVQLNVNADAPFNEFNGAMGVLQQRLARLIGIGPLAQAVIQQLEQAGAMGATPQEIALVFAQMLPNAQRAEELQSQLKNYQEIARVLNRTNIPISRLKVFLEKHGLDPEENISTLMRLTKERDDVVSYAQFCSVMHRQLFVLFGKVAASLRSVISTLLDNLAGFFSVTENQFVRSEIETARQKLLYIVMSPTSYELETKDDELVFRSRDNQNIRAKLFHSVESVIRMTGSVLIKRGPESNRGLIARQDTLDQLWSDLEKNHFMWAERTVKLADLLAVDNERDTGKFIPVMDHVIGMMSTYIREAQTATPLLVSKINASFEQLRFVMSQESKKLRDDINTRVGRVLMDHRNNILLHEIIARNDDINRNILPGQEDQALNFRIPAREYLGHLNSLLSDLSVYFNSNEVAREFKSQQTFNQQISTMQLKLASANRDLKETRDKRDQLDDRFKEVRRLYLALDKAARDTVIYLSQKIVSVSMAEQVDAKVYGELAAAYEHDAADHAPNEDVLMGDRLVYQPPKVLDVAKALGAVINAALKRAGVTNKEVRDFLNSFGDEVKRYNDAMSNFKQVAVDSPEDAVMTTMVINLSVATTMAKNIVASFVRRANTEAKFIQDFNRDSTELIIQNNEISNAARVAIEGDIAAFGITGLASNLPSAGMVHHTLVQRYMRLVTQAEKLREKLEQAESKIDMNKFKEALYTQLSKTLGLGGGRGGGRASAADLLPAAALVNNGMGMSPAEMAAALGAGGGREKGGSLKQLLTVPVAGQGGRNEASNYLGGTLAMRRFGKNDALKVVVTSRYKPEDITKGVKCSYMQIYSFAQKLTGRANMDIDQILKPIVPAMKMSSHEFLLLLDAVDKVRVLKGANPANWWIEEIVEVPVSAASRELSRGEIRLNRVAEEPIVDPGRPTVRFKEDTATAVRPESPVTPSESLVETKEAVDHEDQQRFEEETAIHTIRSANRAQDRRRDRRRGEPDNLSSGEESEVDIPMSGVPTSRQSERKRDLDMDLNQPAQPPRPRKVVTIRRDVNTTDAKMQESESTKKDDAGRKRGLGQNEDDLTMAPSAPQPILRKVVRVKENQALTPREKEQRAMISELIDKILAAVGKPVTVEELDALHREVFMKQIKVFGDMTLPLEKCTSGAEFDSLLFNYLSPDVAQEISTRVEIMRGSSGYADLTAHELMTSDAATSFANVIGCRLKLSDSTRRSGYYSNQARIMLAKEFNNSVVVMEKLMRRIAPYQWTRPAVRKQIY